LLVSNAKLSYLSVFQKHAISMLILSNVEFYFKKPSSPASTILNQVIAFKRHIFKKIIWELIIFVEMSRDS